MIRFEVDGRYLETPENLSLTFKKTNILFGFDNIECERSTSFDIPATPQNDEILELAKWVQTRGAGMRRKYTAQMKDGMIVKSGHLHVDAYSGGSYKAVFVTGELIGLLDIKNAGSARELLKYNSAIMWNDSGVVPANNPTLPNIGLVDYLKRTAHVNPSVSLKWLIQEMVTAVGAQIDFTNTDAVDKARLFESVEKYELDEFDAIMTFATNNIQNTSFEPNLSIFSGEIHDAYVWLCESIPSQLSGYEWDATNAQLVENKQFKQIKCAYDVELTFSETIPDDLCLVSGDLTPQININDDNLRIPFMEERRFERVNGQLVYSGRPLAGRKVKISANTPFFLLDGHGYRYTKPTSAGEEAEIGYYIQSAMSYVEKIRVEVDHSWEYGENVPYNAILPDLTLIELLKMCAYMTGTVLYYDGTIKFDLLNTDTFGTIELNSIIDTGEIKRTFSDYAQENIVQYDSANYVFKIARIKQKYKIDNNNIEKEKELATLKVSEGQRDFDGMYDRVIIPEYDDKVTAADANLNHEYMLRIALPQNEGVQRLCDRSTSVQIRARMTLLEYEQIKPKMALYYNGVRYVWTEIQFNNNTVTFKLSKI